MLIARTFALALAAALPSLPAAGDPLDRAGGITAFDRSVSFRETLRESIDRGVARRTVTSSQSGPNGQASATATGETVEVTTFVGPDGSGGRAWAQSTTGGSSVSVSSSSSSR